MHEFIQTMGWTLASRQQKRIINGLSSFCSSWSNDYFQHHLNLVTESECMLRVPWVSHIWELTIQGELGTTTSKGVFLQCCSWQWILSASRTSVGLKVSLHVVLYVGALSCDSKGQSPVSGEFSQCTTSLQVTSQVSPWVKMWMLLFIKMISRWPCLGTHMMGKLYDNPSENATCHMQWPSRRARLANTPIPERVVRWRSSLEEWSLIFLFFIQWSGWNLGLPVWLCSMQLFYYWITPLAFIFYLYS